MMKKWLCAVIEELVRYILYGDIYFLRLEMLLLAFHHSGFVE